MSSDTQTHSVTPWIDRCMHRLLNFLSSEKRLPCVCGIWHLSLTHIFYKKQKQKICYDRVSVLFGFVVLDSTVGVVEAPGDNDDDDVVDCVGSEGDAVLVDDNKFVSEDADDSV